MNDVANLSLYHSSTNHGALMTTVLKTKTQTRKASIQASLNKSFQRTKVEAGNRSVLIVCTPESYMANGAMWEERVRDRISQIASESNATISSWEMTTHRGMDALRVKFLETIASFAETFQQDILSDLNKLLLKDNRFDGTINSIKVTGNELGGKLVLEYSSDEKIEHSNRNAIRAGIRELFKGRFQKRAKAMTSPKRNGDKYTMEIVYSDTTPEDMA